MEIHQDYLQTGIAIGSRASHEHSSDFLLFLSRFFYVFTRARLSHRNSVRPSVIRVDQAKTVQARITKSSPSAARKTLVSGTV